MSRNTAALHDAIAAAVGKPILSVAVVDWNDRNTWQTRLGFQPTAPETAAVASAIAAFDSTPVRTLELGVLQARIEVEGAWDTYVNYMFGTPARRNAFVKTMFIGKPINADNGGLRTTLTGAGLTTAQIDRILA